MTIPVSNQAVLTLSLFTGTGATFSITGKQVAAILLGAITDWSQVSGSGLSGTIVFVTRSDNSGTTAVFSQFLAVSIRKHTGKHIEIDVTLYKTLWNWLSSCSLRDWPLLFWWVQATNPGWKYIGEGPFTYPNKNVVYAKGSSAVLAGLKSSKATLAVLQVWGNDGCSFIISELLIKEFNKNRNRRYTIWWYKHALTSPSLTWQTGIGKGGGLNELKVQNKAGNYVASTIGSGSFVQALPRVTPPPTASWHGVSLVYQIGVETYPIVSFLYTFYHVKYSSQTVLVKAFAKFTLVRFMS